MSKNAWSLQQMLSHQYKDISHLDKALTAGDTESADREGQRGLSQVGDALMRFIILYEGFIQGLSRKDQQEALSALDNKKECDKLGKRLGIDKLITCSVRQRDVGPQPRTVKNTLSAIVASAYHDSGNVGAVFGVMASLGFVNRPQHFVCPLALTLARSPTTEPTTYVLNEADAALTSVELEAERWTDVLPSAMVDNDGTSSMDHMSIFGFSGDEQVVEPNMPRLASYDLIAQSPDRSSTDPSSESPVFTSSTAAYISSTGSQLESAPNKCRRRGTCGTQEVSSALARSGEKRRQPRKKPTYNIVDQCGEAIPYNVKNLYTSHIDTEAKKGGSDREALTRHIQGYCKDICSLGAPRPEVLTRVALGIASCPAMLALQQAIESVRKKTVDDALYVSRPRPMGERLAAIRHLDLRMAHYRMARRLHILHLYLEAGAESAEMEADGFVSVHALPAANSQNLTGNNNFRVAEKARVTDVMIDRGCVDGAGQKYAAQTRAYYTKLRRFGQRLYKLERMFGMGVFALLDDELHETILASASDKVFDNFLSIVQRYDGEMIRAMSTAAHPIIQLVSDGADSGVVFQIETVTAEYIDVLARGSTEMQSLLSPL